MTNQKSNTGIPTPDRGWVIIATIGAEGVKEKRRTVFVTENEPDHERMHALARELNLEIEIQGMRAELTDDHPDAVIGQLLDVAAMAIHGTIRGATVDPMKAWKNEIEHTVRASSRQAAETLKAVDRLAALVEVALTRATGGGVEAERHNRALHEALEATEAPRPRRDMRRVPEADSEPAQELTHDRPAGYDPRRKPNETESDTMHVRGPANLPGKRVASEMVMLDAAGELIEIPLPRVGDSLKSMAWMSDIPAQK